MAERKRSVQRRNRSLMRPCRPRMVRGSGGMKQVQKMGRREFFVTFGVLTAFFLILFSPVILKGAILGPGDGGQYWVVFKRGFHLWNEWILSGFPAFADPQQLTWYPLRWLIPSFNLFVVSAFVIAGLGAYALAREYRAPPMVAGVSALVYAASGFMMAHLGHTTIIHAAAWLPLIIASIERQARDGSVPWRVGGALAIGVALLAGHPQVVVYGLFVGAALMAVNVFAGMRSDRGTARRLAIGYAQMIALGGALAAIQIIPTAELASQTARATLSFTEFTTYSLPLPQASMMFFPFSWGPWLPGEAPFFGKWNYTELANYFGLSVLVLIAAGFGRITDRKKYFWLIVAVAAFLFTLGSSTPFGQFAFELPLVNKFRVPARSTVIISLAASALVGMALSSLIRQKTGIVTALSGSLPIFAAIAVAAYAAPAIASAASAVGVPAPGMLSETYLVPVFGGGAALLLVLAASKFPRYVASAALLLVCAELTWSSVNMEWRFYAPFPPSLDAPVMALRDSSNAIAGRVVPTEGIFRGPPALLPNINSVFDIRSTSGYGPLLPTHYRNVARLITSGETEMGALNPSILQAMGASHVVYWPDAKGELQFTRGCGAPAEQALVRPVTIVLPEKVKATHLRLRSHMGCAPAIAQDTPVLQITPIGAGIQSGVTVRAGVETAEWALRRADVAPIARHREPPVSEILPGTDGIGLIYSAEFPLATDGSEVTVEGLKIEFPAIDAALRIFSIDLVDTVTNKNRTVPLGFPAGLPITDIEKGADISGGLKSARFTRFLGFAWLVPSAYYTSSARSLDLIRQERSPTGAPLDLRNEVLIDYPEPPVIGAAGITSGNLGLSRLQTRTKDLIRFEVDTPSPQWLVISQQFYPGWRATIDGEATTIYRANHAFQTILAPAGRSVVELRFQPGILYVGAVISLIALGTLVSLLLGAWFSRRPGGVDGRDQR